MKPARSARLFLVAALRMFVTFGFNMLLQARLSEMGIGVFWISMLSTIRGGTATLSSPAWGAISDMAKKRVPLLFFSSIALACVYPLFNLAQGVVGFLLVSALATFFSGAYHPIAMALSAEHGKISVRDTSRSFSFLNASGSVGMFAGRVVLSALLLWFSAKSVIVFFALFAWIPALLCLRIPEGTRTKRRTKERGWLNQLFPLLKNPEPLKRNGLWAIYLSSFLRQFGVSGAMSAIFVFMTQQVLLSASLAVVLSALNPLLQILSHLFSRRVIARLGAVWSTFLGILLSSTVPLWFLFAKGAVSVALGYAFLGLAFGSFFNGASTHITTHTPPTRRAEFMGLLHAARSLGSLLGPLAAGAIAMLSFTMMFSMMFVILFFGAMVVLFFVSKDVPHALPPSETS
ncbi:MAG TPA: MFS transporter [Thermotogota bacterium]|nr:MFS transporter [Thermotogota bacterium]HRW91569.1 MFS transporter [Thermotogota bacterium]